jgi:hypothetical protein
MNRVVQSDCRTGWLVVDSAGRAVSPVFRSRATAEGELRARHSTMEERMADLQAARDGYSPAR